jgi:hypothetical protein
MTPEHVGERAERPVTHLEAGGSAKGSPGLMIQTAQAKTRRHLHLRQATLFQDTTDLRDRCGRIVV